MLASAIDGALSMSAPLFQQWLVRIDWQEDRLISTFNDLNSIPIRIRIYHKDKGMNLQTGVAFFPIQSFPPSNL
jgi:hypothetical protein